MNRDTYFIFHIPVLVEWDPEIEGYTAHALIFDLVTQKSLKSRSAALRGVQKAMRDMIIEHLKALEERNSATIAPWAASEGIWQSFFKIMAEGRLRDLQKVVKPISTDQCPLFHQHIVLDFYLLSDK